MKLLKALSIATASLAIVSCQNDDNSNVVSQKFVHKYGFDMSKEEWQKRDKEGQVITTLKDGVTITNTYNNSVLHGPTTYSFPNTSIVEKTVVYENNNAVKEIFHDTSGLPYKEQTIELDNHKTITLWDKNGVPISIEQYEGEELINGKYYKPDNELEASIENGSGVRMKRERNGELLYMDKIINGELISRTTYHSNGQVKTKMNFRNYKLHGEQVNYSPSGETIMTMTWKSGNLHGVKTVYKNGKKISETPYTNGQKHGIERQFTEDGSLAIEIHWENDKKHGSHRIYNPTDTEIKWYYKGKNVSLKKFEEFIQREKIAADKEQFYKMVNELDEEIAMKD